MINNFHRETAVKYLFTITVLLFFSISSPGQVANVMSQKDNEHIPPSATPLKPSEFGLPTRLIIPRLKTDSRIVQVGLTSSGNMETPSNIVDTGWYKDGPFPGNQGTAVIDGHLDGQHGRPGVFINLYTLQKGDIVQVSDQNGHYSTFVVREIKKYSFKDHPSEVFESKEGAHLNLITCTGPWDEAQSSFIERLVVFTDAVL